MQFIASARRRQRKLVYIGWGSIVVADAKAVTQVVIDAVRKSGVCAILSRGWSDRLLDNPVFTMGANGKNDESLIFPVDSVPHSWLFPQLDAACHHGGSGTLGASLRAGVPTIVRPYFGDQFFWASQVESLHVGMCITNPFTVDRFANALLSCTSDQHMRDNAKALARRLAREDGVANAIHAIYTDYEYAVSRIKQGAAPAFQRPLPTDDPDDGWSIVSDSEGTPSSN